MDWITPGRFSTVPTLLHQTYMESQSSSNQDCFGWLKHTARAGVPAPDSSTQSGIWPRPFWKVIIGNLGIPWGNCCSSYTLPTVGCTCDPMKPSRGGGEHHSSVSSSQSRLLPGTSFPRRHQQAVILLLINQLFDKLNKASPQDIHHRPAIRWLFCESPPTCQQPL